MNEEMMQKLIDTLNNAGAMAKPEEETEATTGEAENETEYETESKQEEIEEETTYDTYTSKEAEKIADRINNMAKENPNLSIFATIAVTLFQLGFLIITIIAVIKSIKNKNKNNKYTQNTSQGFNNFEEKKKFYENYQKRGGAWDYEDAKYYKEATGHEYKSNNNYDSYYNYNSSNYSNTSNNNSSYNNSSNNAYQNTKTETKSGNDFYAAFSALEPDMAKVTYSNFVKKYHPDNGGDMEVMKAINEAYNKYKKEKGIK